MDPASTREPTSPACRVARTSGVAPSSPPTANTQVCGYSRRSSPIARHRSASSAGTVIVRLITTFASSPPESAIRVSSSRTPAA